MGSTLLFRPHGDEPNCLERWAREIQSRLIHHQEQRQQQQQHQQHQQHHQQYSSSSSTTSSSSTAAIARSSPAVADGPLLHQGPASPRGGDDDVERDDDQSSIFLVNGEPNTAFLSPSIRSKTSNLSSIDSDDRSSTVSSSPSELLHLPAPADQLRLQSTISEQIRPPPPSHQQRRRCPGGKDSDDAAIAAKASDPVGSAPGRRETILDRFFSSAPASPAVDGQPATNMSSMARFEALMDELEAARAAAGGGDGGGDGGGGGGASGGGGGGGGRDDDDYNMMLQHPAVSHTIPVAMCSSDRPRRIPSPTQRALEFVSTGRQPRPPGPNGWAANQEAQEQQHQHHQQASPFYITGLPTATGMPAIQSSERSDSDNDTLHTTYTASTGSIAADCPAAAPLVPATQPGKRHSLADFSIMRLATPPLFAGADLKDGGVGGGGMHGGAQRRISYGDLEADCGCGVSGSGSSTGGVVVVGDGAEFGRVTHQHHLNVDRPLFREFSF